MGKRGKTKEVLRTLQKSYRKKVKRDSDEKQVPTLRNFDIPRNVPKENLSIYVRDLLGTDKVMASKVMSMRDKKATKLITSIQCPCCGKEISFDRRWNCYICQSEEKKIFEIVKAVKIKEGKT